jgi:hypothetical protein
MTTAIAADFGHLGPVMRELTEKQRGFRARAGVLDHKELSETQADSAAVLLSRWIPLAFCC